MTDVADRCSIRSEAAHESLAGTASTIRRWLLVEHPGPWGRDGLVDARLPDGLGLALRELGRRTPCRPLLIRRPVAEPAAAGSIACFAVDSRDAWIGSRTLDRLEDAADLDPADRSAFQRAVDGPVAVVCTHGRRDVCCAERGRPLAAATAVEHPAAVWESTHVGGDRFAGNLIVFPHGLVFGRVEPERGAGIVSAYAARRIELDRYRGRTSHPFPAQAAEVALRLRTGLDRIEDVRVRAVRRHGDVAWVRLEVPDGDAIVTMLRRNLPPMRLTCSSRSAEMAVTWIAESIEIEPRPNQRGASSSS